MYTDAQLRLSNAQSLVGAAATTVSTNSIDLLSANRNVARGQRLRLFVQVNTAFAGGTSVQVQYIQSANADLSSPDVLGSAAVFTDAQAVSGAILADRGLENNTKRYIGVQYVTLGTHTAGTVTAHLVSDTDYNNYPPMNTGY